MRHFIDITVPLRHGMAHHPADPPIVFTPLLSMDQGHIANVTGLSLSAHSGTHFDAPYHMIADGKKADAYPADYFCGKARVIECLSDEDIGQDALCEQGIERGDIVLLKTMGSAHMHDEAYYNEHVNILGCAAAFLAEASVKAVGFDYLSIEEDEAFSAHRILLGAGIPIIEGLDLTEANAGLYRMTAMFLPIKDGDGAPLRAILEEYVQ